MFPTSNSGRVCCLRGARRLSLLLFVGFYAQLFHSGTIGLSQEAFRSSRAGQDACEEKRRALAAGHYNIKFANLAFDLGTRLGIEYNDNVYYYGTGLQLDDLIFRPELDATTTWVLTDRNILSLKLEAGYAKYVKNTILDSPYLRPGSDLSFDVFVRDFVIHFYDRFSLLQDVSGQIISVTNVAYLNSFDNTAGVRVDWDLNKLILATEYDHRNYLSMTAPYDYLTSQSELFSGSAKLEFNRMAWVGLEAGGGFMTHEMNVLSGLRHIYGGALLEFTNSAYFDLQLKGGYVVYFADISGSLNGASDKSGLYSSLTVSHQVKPKIGYSVTAGHEFGAGTSGNMSEAYYVIGRANWRVIRRSSLETSLFYQHATETYTRTAVPWDHYSISVSLDRELGPKLKAKLSYSFAVRDSSVRTIEYTQNRVVFDLRYRF